MESPQHIKSRRLAVKNVGQITKAMEVVSATKMRRSQEVALRSRPYAFKALDLLMKFSHHADTNLPLGTKRPTRTTLLIVVASDRGLAGSFNASVSRALDTFIERDAHILAGVSEHSYKAIVVGKKAYVPVVKKNISVVKELYGYGDSVTLQDIEPLVTTVFEGYERGEWDRVVTVSTHFRTTLKQDTLVREILPIDPKKVEETVREIVPEYGRFSLMQDAPQAHPASATDELEYILEPTPHALLEALVPHLLRMQIYHLLLEANASEHSARMVAMKTASDNANELSDDLLLVYNKARQALITKEIIEITSTQNALQ